jgi:TonB family protein
LPAPLLQPVPVDVAVLATAEPPPAFSEEPNDQEVPGSPLSINQSVFRALSALEDRSVVYAPPLPTIKGLAQLTPTQVRVGVDAGGLVLYALLDRSSGDDTVDAQALELARQFRFEAEDDSGPSSLTWGVLRFLWATQSVSATNTDSAATPH